MSKFVQDLVIEDVSAIMESFRFLNGKKINDYSYLFLSHINKRQKIHSLKVVKLDEKAVLQVIRSYTVQGISYEDRPSLMNIEWSLLYDGPPEDYSLIDHGWFEGKELPKS